MSGLARRIAPAAALGGLAVIAVGVLDPAISGITSSGASATATGAGGTSSQPGSATGGSGSGTTDTATGSSGSGTGCSTAEEIVGEAVMTRWGAVQVAATVSGGTLCEVRAIAYPSNDSRSVQINAYAIPILDRSASEAGTQFDAVSGATYTSEAYRDSLQSILDSL